MRIDWSELDLELKCWRAAKLDLPLWWRDDDASSQTIQLDQLARLSEKMNLAAHLAVIPKPADQSLVQAVQDRPHLVPLVHGWAHQNHAPDGAKKAEFGHDRAALRSEASMGLERMRALFGAQVLAVFVPPWNRIDPAFLSGLADIGYCALSTFTPRRTRFAAPNLIQINTHVDPIHWRGGGGLAPVDRLLSNLVALLQDRRAGHTDTAEPLGILTHHLVHDAEIWQFIEACLGRLLDGGARPVNLSAEQAELP